MNSVILTSYFTKKEHPNSIHDTHVIGRGNDGKVSNNRFEYIQPWYDSINQIDVHGVIFHDDLSDDFCNQYSNDKITFVKVEESKWSNLDYRWMCYEKFIKQKDNYENIFMTDCSDVSVVKDPSQLVRDESEIDLFVGKDSIKLSQFGYLNFHDRFGLEDKVWFMLNMNRLDLINMGIIGGGRDNVLHFLSIYNDFRLSLGAPEFGQADMYCGQYVFRILLQDKSIMIGYPVCSEFKQYQNDREDVYFIHK